MDRLQEHAHHYRDGLITAGEFMLKVCHFLCGQTDHIRMDTIKHDLADALSKQLLKD